MPSYSYRKIRGHLLVDVQGQFWLLDTGAPFSIGDAALQLAGREFCVHENYLGVCTGFLSEHLGAPIAGVIGADVVRAFTVSIDPENGLISFDTASLTGSIVLPVQEFMGIPLLRMAVAGKVTSALFDTGAELSYLLPDAFRGHRAVGNWPDFYPLTGPISSDVYAMPVAIGGEELAVHFAALPEVLRPVLDAAKVGAIIGADFLRHFSMSISLSENAVMLERRDPQLLRAIA